MTEGVLVDRKNEHLDIVLDSTRAVTKVRSGFDAYRLVHCALPELDLGAIDLSASLVGKPLRAPILISSMTGGAERAALINRHLAVAAQQLGIALAVGSQRVALQSGRDSGLTRELRQLAPDIPLLANIGATQLTAHGVDWARAAVEMIEADALIVHLNVLQEAVQPEGDRDWRGVTAALATLVKELGAPVVIKEVGAGISPAVAQRLADIGVAAIDVAGAGGTNWALVEAERSGAGSADVSRTTAPVGHAFADWGIPSAEAILAVRRALPSATLIASGGVRDGVEAAKAIRLGADVVAQAAAVLTPALHSADAVVAHFEALIQQLRIACLCTGSGSLAALRQAPTLCHGQPLE